MHKHLATFLLSLPNKKHFIYNIIEQTQFRVFLSSLTNSHRIPNLCSNRSYTHEQNSSLNRGFPGKSRFDRNGFYTYLFSQLQDPSCLLEAKRLHALLTVNGFLHGESNDRVFGSQLVNVYVKFNCLDEAFYVFDNLPQRNNIAYNAIIRGLVGCGQFKEAIEFFYWMLEQGVVPDNFTYPLVLKACSGIRDVLEGKKVLEVMEFNEIHYGRKPNGHVECAMIDMFAKCGSLDSAWIVFEGMHRKDLSTWTAMIGGAMHNGEWIGGLWLFNEMRLEGVKPDPVMMASIVSACGRLENKQTGMTLHGLVITSGLENDIYVSNTLVDMYCKCGEMCEAHKVFHNMKSMDAVSWSTLVAGYSQNSRYLGSIELFLEMQNAGVRTDAIIVSSILPGLGNLKLLKHGKEMHAYVLKQAFESDAVIGCALIDMYMNCGSNQAAEHIFKIMSHSDIMIWNSTINGYSINDDADSALEVFRRIWKCKLKPNFITIVSVLPICSRVGNLKHGKELHGYAIRSGLIEVVSVENSLIDMYCKCGYLEPGINIFRSMTKKNVVTYNTIICAHATHGLGQKTFWLFREMEELGIQPNEVNFLGLLSACSHTGLVKEGRLIYHMMTRKYKLVPKLEHYSCMVDLLGRAGEIDSAWNFIQLMHVEPDIDVLGSLLGACRLYNKVELAMLIEKQIFNQNHKDPGYHILLHNLYASAHCWEDALMIRTMIKEKGLTKIPGRSWIQIGSAVYVFHARGDIHSEVKSIYYILDCLTLEMKENKCHKPDQNLLFKEFSEDLT